MLYPTVPLTTEACSPNRRGRVTQATIGVKPSQSWLPGCGEPGSQGFRHRHWLSPSAHTASPPGPSQTCAPPPEQPALTAIPGSLSTMGWLRPWACYWFLLVAHLLALGLGALVLQALEGPPALQLQTELRAALAAFQAEHRDCLPPGALEELLSTALRAQAHGVSNLGDGLEASSWDLPSALLFVTSILTTTGKATRRPPAAGCPRVPVDIALPPGLRSPRASPTPRREAPHTNTPQLVPPLQLPAGVRLPQPHPQTPWERPKEGAQCMSNSRRFQKVSGGAGTTGVATSGGAHIRVGGAGRSDCSASAPAPC